MRWTKPDLAIENLPADNRAHGFLWKLVLQRALGLAEKSRHIPKSETFNRAKNTCD